MLILASRHSDIGTFIAHAIIRGFIYRVMFHLPWTIAAVVAVGAFLYMRKRRSKAKSND